MVQKLYRQAVLPKHTQFIYMSKEIIRDWYEKSDEFKKLTVIDNNYDIDSEHSLHFFDFSDDPLEGIYKTLIVDLKQCFVLTKQSTHTLSNQIYHRLTAGARELQLQMAQEIGIRFLHVISLGYMAFFSRTGHSKGNTDWVALHHMHHVRYDRDHKTMTFTTSEIKGQRLTFVWENVNEEMLHHYHDSLHHNHIFRDILTPHMQSLRFPSRGIFRKYKSVLDRNDITGTRCNKQHRFTIASIVQSCLYNFGLKIYIRFCIIYGHRINEEEYKTIYREIFNDRFLK